MKQVLKVAGIITFSTFASAFLIAGWVSEHAIFQPTIADAIYRNPENFKGVVVYLTDWQQLVYSIAMPIGFAAFIVTVALSLIYSRLQKRDQDEA